MAKTTKKARNPGVTRAIFYFSHKNDPLRFPTITEFRGKQLFHPAPSLQLHHRHAGLALAVAAQPEALDHLAAPQYLMHRLA